MDPFQLTIPEGFRSRTPSPNIPCARPISKIVCETLDHASQSSVDSSDEDLIPCAQPFSHIVCETPDHASQSSDESSDQNIYDHHA